MPPKTLRHSGKRRKIPETMIKRTIYIDVLHEKTHPYIPPPPRFGPLGLGHIKDDARKPGRVLGRAFRSPPAEILDPAEPLCLLPLLLLVGLLS